MGANGGRTAGTALVTGASSGIGEEFARQLARRGWNLVLVARRKDRLEQLATALSAIRGVRAEVIQADLATDAGAAQVEERLRSGDIDLLVNNAGFGTVGEFGKLPLARELGEINLNVRALVHLTHAALEPMMERRRGAIINVASMAAFEPVPYNATYAATKAFVLHFSEAVHEEAKEYGVTVTCLCPGPVRTEFQQVAGIDGRRMRARVLLRYMARTGVDTVVEAALSAMEEGRAVVIPGVLHRAIAATARTGPRPLFRRMAGTLFRDQGNEDSTT